MGKKETKPTKCTKKTIAKVKKALLLGATYKIAAQYAGISRSSFMLYMKENSDFSDAVGETEAECAIFLLGKLNEAARDGDTTTAKYILERRYGYSAKSEMDVNIGVMQKLDEEADNWLKNRPTRKG